MTHWYSDDSVTLLAGDALTVLRAQPAGSVDCCVTSPPYYGLRDYGHPCQIGAEATSAQYVARLVAVFAQVRRVLADEGTCWLVLGDSYSSTGGHTDHGRSSRLAGGRRVVAEHQRGLTRPPPGVPPKNLLGIPWRVALALQDEGWVLRSAVVWHKPNALPESVADRPRSMYEHVFLLTKSSRYWFDRDGLGEPEDVARHVNGFPYSRGNVWSIPTQPSTGGHPATFPVALAERCVLAGCRPGGTVLDPFSGSGTTGLAATRHGRRYVGIDLSTEYLDLSLRTRLAQGVLVDGGAA